MSDFQLILLSERKRAGRVAHPEGQFVLLQFRYRTGTGMAAQTYSRQEIAEWLSPLDALVTLAEVFGDQKVAATAIVQRLRGGLIQAAADRSHWEGINSGTDGGLQIIPPERWAHYSSTSRDAKVFWRTGDIRLYLAHFPRRGEGATVWYYGVKLETRGIREMIPAEYFERPKPQPAAAPAQIEAPKVNKGGRPRFDFWDDLWIEICAHIHEEGIPAQQADIENAMLDWAAKNGHDLSLSSVRPRARKLLQRLQNPRTKT